MRFIQLSVTAIVCILLPGQIELAKKAGQCSPTSDQKPVPADTVITKSETGEYWLKISSDGAVVFQGTTFDFDIAKVKTKVSREDLSALVCEFERVDYSSFADKYEDQEDGCVVVWTDQVSVSTSITINGKRKSVTRYIGCRDKQGSAFPKGLVDLEMKIDETVGLKRRR